eukprot:symbB.v1.2.007398.t1/scaffold452.1/size203995/11
MLQFVRSTHSSVSERRGNSVMRFLFIFVATAAAERSAISQEEAASHKHVNLNGENASLVLATQEDLLDMQKVMLQDIDKVNLELQETIKSTYQVLDEAAAAEAQKVQDDAHAFLERTYATLYTLQVSEWRLQMAARHGIHGRCCCVASSMSSCEWVDHWLLVGHLKTCPEHMGKDYLDHYADRKKAEAQNELTADEVVPLNRLVDSCRASSGWQQHVEGRQDYLVEAIPADALQAVKDIAVWPAIQLPGIMEDVSS